MGMGLLDVVEDLGSCGFLSVHAISDRWRWNSPRGVCFFLALSYVWDLGLM